MYEFCSKIARTKPATRTSIIVRYFLRADVKITSLLQVTRDLLGLVHSFYILIREGIRFMQNVTPPVFVKCPRFETF